MNIKKSEYDQMSKEVLEARNMANSTQNELEKVKKELEESKATIKNRTENNSALHAEIEGVHGLLDNLPDAPPKHPEDRTYVTLGLQTRIACWLAKRMK